jgi:hypothetical protein
VCIAATTAIDPDSFITSLPKKGDHLSLPHVDLAHLGFQPGDFVIAFIALAFFVGQATSARALALLGRACAVIVSTTSAKPA